MDSPKQLIDQIQSNPLSGQIGSISNELLRAFHRGYPLDELGRMLESADNDVIAIAIWITSELGKGCKPLLPKVVPLLDNPLRRVRFWALDCLLWLSPEKGCDIARGLAMIGDPEPGIRRKVLDLLSRLSTGQLEAALKCSDENASASDKANGLRWLLSEDAFLGDRIMHALKTSNGNVRKYAAVAAARFIEHDREPLRFAATVDDPDIVKFSSRLLGD
jgi:hypothetical protein